MRQLLEVTTRYGITTEEKTSFGVKGYQICRSMVLFLSGDGTREDGRPVNPYFADLYQRLADGLTRGEPILAGLEAREHTAQVAPARRIHRERRFRFKPDDQKAMVDEPPEGEPAESAQRLPLLFCSPTMELGVDISALDVVYMRNVPPTPANYTQRAGRAGRAGQAALVMTYCAAQSPHDRYYFRDPRKMVNGVVRPPSLDLHNEDLVRAHLNAVWLAQTYVPLEAAIVDNLDMTDPAYPLKPEIADKLRDPTSVEAAIPRMVKVLELIGTSEYGHTFAEETAREAFARLEAAFDSWRRRLKAAEAQQERANQIYMSNEVTEDERQAARQARATAEAQIERLKDRRSGTNTDFYVYRYLATEGFLPGYNFPRLPLTAFLPARAGSKGDGNYLSRGRFLAIAEFGPLSLVYHEGQAYRVTKAMLPPDAREASGRELKTRLLVICAECGTLQSDPSAELCESCAHPTADARRIDNALPIENVETRPAERITANDEERQRQGFEVQTAFSWENRTKVRRAEARDAGALIAEMIYGEPALIMRFNKGLKRRKDKGVNGYFMGVNSGRWAGNPEKPGEDSKDNPLKEPVTRVVPMVEDRKNALLIRIGEHSAETMATLEAAFVRAVTLRFQLEEAEISVEPVPDRERRNALLIYEATEGGAGALAQLVDKPQMLAEGIRMALGEMHYREENGSWVEIDDAPCVAGCYRCVLSYTNQPDHILIDRRDDTALAILQRLTVAQVTRPTGKADGGLDDRDRSEASPWAAAAARWGLPAPDGEPLETEAGVAPAAWRSHWVAVADSDALAQAIERAGLVPIRAPADPPADPPEGLVDLLQGEAAE